MCVCVCVCVCARARALMCFYRMIEESGECEKICYLRQMVNYKLILMESIYRVSKEINSMKTVETIIFP